MPAAKLCSSETLNAMNSEEGNDSLDTFIRQAIGKDPLLPFPRSADNPVPWYQFLHAFDQPDQPGWPLLTSVKVQMQKCKKCSREFCSPINYRRHIRVHRRSLNVNKGCLKNRDLLAAFWDKLTLDQAKEVMSFTDVMLKDIPGSSVIEALASSLCGSGVWNLPQAYVKAGAALLDIIQAKPSRLPISSKELFSILDDASERTFLCAGTAESVQKYVFDAETIKNSLELKNLVANTCFLFEQQLVKAWVAHKDAEAFRCHKLLVEEEEAAARRQAMLLERKKQKKLRQKEQKEKEELNGFNGGLSVTVAAADRPTSAEASGPSSPSDSNPNSPETPTDLNSIQGSQTMDPLVVGPNDCRNLATTRLQAPKSQRGSQYGTHQIPNLQVLKPEPTHKLGPAKDRNLPHGSKVWTKKLKTNCDGDNMKPPSLQGAPSHQIEQNDSEVIIGSIPITLKSCFQQGSFPSNTCSTEHAVLKKKNANSLQFGINRTPSKLWRPVSRGETKKVPPIDRSNEDSESGVMLRKVHDHIPSSERSGQSQYLDNDNRKKLRVVSDDNAQQGFVPFSSDVAKEFLSRRWKEAISSNHVKLELSSAPEPLGCPVIQLNSSTEANISDPLKSSILGYADNHVGRNIQVQFIKKPEKTLKFKYIPKQKAAA